jgi:hypothetical protein
MVLPTGHKMNLDQLESQAKMASDLIKNPAMRDALKNAVKGLDPKQLEAMGRQIGGQQ